jgi:hypothetical protein
MKDIAIYAWCFFLASLTFGLWTFPLVIILVVINLIIIRYKSKWFY